MVFKCKFDTKYLVFIGVINALSLILIMSYFRWWTILIAVIIAIATIPAIFNNSAQLTDKMLILKFGLCKKKYLIDDIVTIDKCKYIKDDSEIYFDRVYIVLKNDDIVISPKDNSLFIQELLKINTNIKI